MSSLQKSARELKVLVLDRTTLAFELQYVSGKQKLSPSSLAATSKPGIGLFLMASRALAFTPLLVAEQPLTKTVTAKAKTAVLTLEHKVI
jgi:hypothetical protein